jgi:nitroreductase
MPAPREGSPERCAEILRARRSINLFEPQAVGKAALLEAISLARWAPNHRLTEPWKFYIVGAETAEAIARCAARLDTETKGEKAGAARYARLSAIPGNFVVTSRRSDDELLDREDYAATCCAVQNLMLYLWQCGIGVKWTTGAITRERRFYELLDIDPEAERVVGFFWYGKAKLVPPERPRKPVEEIVVDLP